MERYRKRDNSRRLLVALFGELLNIDRHCYFILRDLPPALITKKDVMVVKIAKHGPLKMIRDNISEYGFLTYEDIRDLIQLSMQARNDDLIIDTIVQWSSETPMPLIEEELAALRRRFEKRQVVVKNLLASIASRNPKLKPLLQWESGRP